VAKPACWPQKSNGSHTHEKHQTCKVEAPISHRITDDPNKAVSIDLAEPQLNEFGAIETFTLSRREQISGVDARNVRPLSANKRAELAPFPPTVNLSASTTASGLSRLNSSATKKDKRYFVEIILGS